MSSFAHSDGVDPNVADHATPSPMSALIMVINSTALEAARRSDALLPGIVESVESVVMYVAGTPKSRYGHYLDEAWRSGNRRSAEIVLNAGFLDRPAENVMTTLLHEMAHAYASANNIPDTSRDGRYHNRRFAEVAIQLGAHVVKDADVGHRTRGLTPEGRERYGDLLGELADVLTLVREPVGTVSAALPPNGSTALPASSTGYLQRRKYVFPVCGCRDRRGRPEVAGRVAVGKWLPGKLACTICGSPLVDPQDDEDCPSLDNDPEAPPDASRTSTVAGEVQATWPNRASGRRTRDVFGDPDRRTRSTDRGSVRMTGTWVVETG